MRSRFSVLTPWIPKDKFRGYIIALFGKDHNSCHGIQIVYLFHSKWFVMVGLFRIHATLEDVYKVLQREVQNVGEIVWIRWNDPASTTNLLHEIQRWGWKIHSQYVSDLWRIKANISDTACCTEDIDVQIVIVVRIKEEPSVSSLLYFGKLTMNYNDFIVVNVIISVEIITNL